MSKTKITACIIGLLLISSPVAHAATFKIDPGRSTLIFKIKQLSIDTVGAFTRFRGTMELNSDNTQPTDLKATVDLKSVNTRQSQRDEDLLGQDIFNAAKFPAAKFVSKKIDGQKISGELTLRGVTKPVSFNYQLGKVENKNVSISARGTIRPKDFGITFNRALEKGKPLLGDSVEIVVEAVGILQ
ncbi:MAG: YceI family protein [Candidatus Omnitrophota bacterium]